MRYFLLLGMLLLSCGNETSNNPPVYNPKPDPKPVISPELPVTPEPPDFEEETDTIGFLELFEYAPIEFQRFDVKKTDLPYIHDYLSWQKGIADNFGKTRDTGHIPSLYSSLWDGNLTYVDETNGEVKGIEKLKKIREDMLTRCPILKEPQYNSPVEILWQISTTKRYGRYLNPPLAASYDKDGKLIYNGGPDDNLKAKIIIIGKNDSWDYPNQTSTELGEPWGIDDTFVHEWGHHLESSISLNTGKNTHFTWIFTESFADLIRETCFKSTLEILDTGVTSEFDTALSSEEVISEQEKYLQEKISYPYNYGWTYRIRSFTQCIAHEMYFKKWEPNKFATALIEAYKRIEGRKLENNPYPIKYLDETKGKISGSWVAGDDPRLSENQPLLTTRSEFIERFLEVYDCGLANRLLKADAIGQRKFEW